MIMMKKNDENDRHNKDNKDNKAIADNIDKDKFIYHVCESCNGKAILDVLTTLLQIFLSLA